MKSIINHLSIKKMNVIKAVTAVTELNTTTTTLVFLGKIDANLSWISIIVSILPYYELANHSVSSKEVKTLSAC